MKAAYRGTFRSLAALLLLCSGPALATTVYKSVDERGVVTYSDTRPEGDSPVETLHIDTPDPEVSPEDRERLEAMRETTDRMAADRREREKHRAEMRRLQAETDRPVDYGPANYGDYMGYTTGHPGYWAYPPRRPWRPGYRPGHRPGHGHRPEHPIVRPPLRPHPVAGPQPQIQTGSNAQLMRPLVSPRR